jgi:hypothetical protein
MALAGAARPELRPGAGEMAWFDLDQAGAREMAWLARIMPP